MEIKEWLIKTKMYLNLTTDEADELLIIWANQGFTCKQAAERYMLIYNPPPKLVL